jgi:hypothetical protein
MILDVIIIMKHQHQVSFYPEKPEISAFEDLCQIVVPISFLLVLGVYRRNLNSELFKLWLRDCLRSSKNYLIKLNSNYLLLPVVLWKDALTPCGKKKLSTILCVPCMRKLIQDTLRAMMVRATRLTKISKQMSLVIIMYLPLFCSSHSFLLIASPRFGWY